MAPSPTSSIYSGRRSAQRRSSTDTVVPLLIDVDVEGTVVSPSPYEDPYELRKSIMPEEEIALLQKSRRGRRVANYHQKQNDLINALLKPMEEHTAEARAAEEESFLAVQIAIYASLIGNCILCLLQVYAAVSAGSLSLLATGIDSVFDAGSNGLLFWLHKKAQRLNVNKWPVGGARLETIGNIIYGFLMGSVNLLVVVESLQTIANKEDDDLQKFHLPSIIAVGVALLVKILLFLYCFSLRNRSSQVRVLWEDHRNDLWINGFGIIMSMGGSKLVWYLDPLGAIIIGAGVIIAWGSTIYSEFELLAGKSAPHDFLQLIIYKAATFSDEIVGIDTVRAYHSGPDYFVEVDVVMPADTPLWKSHDLSQHLQDKLETLPGVERAFVHVDHETTHTPEHRKLISI